MITIILLIIVLFFLFKTSESFVLVGSNKDLFEIAQDTIIPYSQCSIQDDNSVMGQKVILKTNDGNYYNSCDFGLEEESKCAFPTKCQGNDCSQKIIPLMTINNEKRCRLVPYEGPYK